MNLTTYVISTSYFVPGKNKLIANKLVSMARYNSWQVHSTILAVDPDQKASFEALLKELDSAKEPADFITDDREYLEFAREAHLESIRQVALENLRFFNQSSSVA